MAMFTQRKSFFKGKLFYIILLLLFAFGLWLNQPIKEKAPDDINTGTDYPEAGDKAVKQGEGGAKGDYDILDSIIEKNQPVSTSEGAVGAGNDPVAADLEDKGYYLVKEINGVIKIFYYDNEGKESLVRETDIAFSLLSVTDQTLFQKGVIRHSPEELDELLQDFES
jgi:hypothetical protein